MVYKEVRQPAIQLSYSSYITLYTFEARSSGGLLLFATKGLHRSFITLLPKV